MFFACATQRLPILSMQSVNASLEEVFLELTGGKELEAAGGEGSERSLAEDLTEPLEEESESLEEGELKGEEAKEL